MTTTVITVVVAATVGGVTEALKHVRECVVEVAAGTWAHGAGRRGLGAEVSVERGKKPRKPWQRIPARVMKKHTSQLSHHKYLSQRRRHHATATTTIPSGGQRDLRAPLTAWMSST
ncbi:hypothetical protein EDB83DRAFT_2381905 [Lactarius deliciosus]|nr:hypothetical protein EDB83DRAFT_2381905 [Lactarius deliciosus]